MLKRFINLQLFAGGTPDEDKLDIPDAPLEVPEVDPDQEVPESEPQETPEVPVGEPQEIEDEEHPEDKPVKRPDQAEIDRIVQQRLARQQRQQERELSRVAGVPLTSEQISQAASLWGYLTQNPQVAQQVQQILNQTYNPNSRNPVSERMAELDIRETVMDLRAEDPIFRRHENEIQAWANQQGIQIKSGKDIELAYNAWKGQNYRRDMANAELQAQRKLTQNLKSKQKAAVTPARPSRVTPKLDYSKMSPADILKAEGLKLFKDEE